MDEEPHSKELHDMARAHFNEPMIWNHELARCVGYGETAVDCYVIIRRSESGCEKGKLFWVTCVGGYTWLDRLKGQGYVKSVSGEDWDDLFRLDSDLKHNGCPREPEFILVLRHDEWEGSSPRTPVEQS